MTSVSHPFFSTDEKAAGAGSGGKDQQTLLDSDFDGVSALAILSLGGHDRQLHLLCDGPRQEAPDAVRLPARRLHQFLSRCAVRTLQQVEYFRGLGTSRAPAAFFALVGAFLAGLVFFPDFAFLGAAFARRLPGVAFLVGFAKTLSAVCAVSV